MGRGMMAVALLAVAALPMGCGGKDIARAVDPVAEAADRTVAAGGAELTGDGAFRAMGVTVPIAISGSVDFEERRTHLKMDVRRTKALAGVDLSDAGFPMEYISESGRTVWFATAAMRGKLPDGKRWGKVELGDLDDDTGLAFQQLNRFDESNPAEWLRMLRTAGGAKEAGTATIDGVRTTHYKATIEPRRFPETVSEDERAKARETVRQIDEFDRTLLDPSPVDVWIDADGLIRRERVLVDETFEGVRTRGRIVIDFVNFDRDLEVDTPGGDETLDVTDAVASNFDG